MFLIQYIKVEVLNMDGNIGLYAVLLLFGHNATWPPV